MHYGDTRARSHACYSGVPFQPALAFNHPCGAQTETGFITSQMTRSWVPSFKGNTRSSPPDYPTIYIFKNFISIYNEVVSYLAMLTRTALVFLSGAIFYWNLATQPGNKSKGKLAARYEHLPHAPLISHSRAARQNRCGLSPFQA